MKILIVDTDGCGLDLAIRAMGYGHDVEWFIKPRPNGSQKYLGHGLVNRVLHWEPRMNWADLVILTGNDKYMEQMEVFRKRGYPIYGSNEKGAQLEIKRDLGEKLLKKHGIPTIESHMFSNYKEAMNHVIKTGERYVSKTLGDCEDKALSYVSKGPEDLYYMLTRWEKQGKYTGPLMLQKFVKGIEIGVSGWMGKEGFLKDKWNINWEHKKLMSGEHGPNTGEMGTVMQYTKKEKLADEMLLPLERYLMSIGYMGDVDLNCIIDEKGNPWPLEFTTRMGWPAFYIQTAACKGDPVQWMQDAINGEDTLKVSYDASIGVVLAQPDFPYSHATKRDVLGVPVFGLNDKNLPHIHPSGMMLGQVPRHKDGKMMQDPGLVSCEDYILVMTSLASTVKKARELVYSRIDAINIPNSILYRDDIGERLEKQLPELHKFGYALSLEYE